MNNFIRLLKKTSGFLNKLIKLFQCYLMAVITTKICRDKVLRLSLKHSILLGLKLKRGLPLKSFLKAKTFCLQDDF